MRDYIVLFLHTLEGAKVAAGCFSYGTPKDRKLMLKTMKEHSLKIAKEEYGHLVLLRALDVVDDTLQVEKMLLSPLLPQLTDLVTDKHGSKWILHILSPYNKRYFDAMTLQLLKPTLIPGKDGAMVPTSHKSAETRREELLQYIATPLAETCANNVRKFASSPVGTRVLYETVKACESSRSELLSAILGLVLPFSEENKATEDDDEEEEEEDEEAKTSTLLDDYHVSAFLRLLLKEDFIKQEENAFFLQGVAQRLKGYLPQVVATQGGEKIVVALLENSSGKTHKQVVDELLPVVGSGKQLDPANLTKKNENTKSGYITGNTVLSVLKKQNLIPAKSNKK